VNVTAIVNESVMTKQVSKAEVGDAEAFSQELTKQLKPSKEDPNADVKEDPSDLTSDGEQPTDDTDVEHAFIIVPTFLRFETHTELSKAVMVDTPANAQDIAEGVKHLDTLVSMTVDVSEAVENIEMAMTENMDVAAIRGVAGELPVDGVETIVEDAVKNDTQGEDVTLDKTKTLDGLSESHGTTAEPVTKDVTDILNKVVNETDGLIDEPSVESKKESPNARSAKAPDAPDTKAPDAKADTLIDTLTAVKTTDSSTIDNSDKGMNVANSEWTTPEIDGVKTITASDTKETETIDDTVSNQIKLTQPQQSTKQVERMTRAEPAQTMTHVTLEESPEMIQDLMMTTASNASGDKVYQSRLTLTPETLGQITVELTYSEEGLTGRLVFNTDEAKQWVENQWQQIKKPLELNGLSLDTIDFQVVKPQDSIPSTPFNFSHQSDQSKREEHGKRKNTRHASHQSEDESRPTEAILRHGYGLNYYA